MSPKITEAEIVDVLLGGADPQLAARVKDAIARDEKAAALYDEWARVLPLMRAQTAPARQLAASVQKRVHERLPYEYPSLYTSSKSLARLEQGHYGKPLASRRLTVSATWGLYAAAAAAAAIIAVFSISYFAGSPGTPLASGAGSLELAATRATERQLSWMLPDDKPPVLPATDLQKGAEATTLDLPGGPQIRIQEGAEVFVKDSAIWQTAGTVQYTVSQHSAGEFNVRIPQGVVYAMESIYEISVIPGRSTLLQVASGRVRIVTSRGSELNVESGQTATLEDNKDAMLLGDAAEASAGSSR